jgi:cysteine dioxygenase
MSFVDQIGLHRVENESHSNQAASLHLYSPPFDMAQSFDQRTGKAFQCQVTFYSEKGQIQK